MKKKKEKRVVLEISLETRKRLEKIKSNSGNSYYFTVNGLVKSYFDKRIYMLPADVDMSTITILVEKYRKGLLKL